jgi:Skp family chaperone for outer membrane proteins
MSDSTNSIADRVKQRTQIKERTGRVGGSEHKKKIELRKKQVERRKQYAKNKNNPCYS